MKSDDENQAENDTHRCVNWIDNEHHDQCSHQAQECGVPGEVFKSRPEVDSTSYFDSKTSQIGRHVAQHE